MGKKRHHRLLVPSHDGFVQRGESGGRGIRVGALLEQELDEIAIARVRSQHQCAHAPRVGIVHVSAGRDKKSGRFKIANARGKHQRRVASVRDTAVVFKTSMRRHRLHVSPFVGLRLHIRAVREEHLDDVRMPLGDGPHECGLASRTMRVHIRALREQLLDDLSTARPRRHHQGCFTGEQREIRIGPSQKKSSHHRRTAVHARCPQRRRTELVCDVDVRTRLNQQRRALLVIPIARPHQCCGPVGFRRVDVHTFLDQRRKTIAIAVPDREDEIRAVVGERHRR